MGKASREAGDIDKSCRCSSLPDLAVLGIGDESAAVARRSLHAIAKRGGRYWWLRCGRCDVCGQVWLDAQEERINDVWVMRKLHVREVERLIHDGVWPNDLDKYVTLLRAGRSAGVSVRWISDPRTSQMLRQTLHEIRAEDPDLSVEDAAVLLGMTIGEAQEADQD